jgi:hypothetical protein
VSFLRELSWMKKKKKKKRKLEEYSLYGGVEILCFE